MSSRRTNKNVQARRAAALAAAAAARAEAEGRELGEGLDLDRELPRPKSAAQPLGYTPGASTSAPARAELVPLRNTQPPFTPPSRTPRQPTVEVRKVKEPAGFSIHSLKNPRFLLQVLLRLALVVVTNIVVLITLVGALPILGHGLRVEPVLLGVVPSSFLIFYSVKVIRSGDRLFRLLTLVLSVGLALATTLGVHNTVVIRSKVYASSSNEALSYKLILSMGKDIITLKEIDDLASATPAQATSRFDEYPAVIDTLTNMNKRFGDTSYTPNSRVRLVQSLMQQASSDGITALKARSELAGLSANASATQIESADSATATFRAARNKAATELIALSALYDISTKQLLSGLGPMLQKQTSSAGSVQ